LHAAVVVAQANTMAWRTRIASVEVNAHGRDLSA
jgi:hypothetical protein